MVQCFVIGMIGSIKLSELQCCMFMIVRVNRRSRGHIAQMYGSFWQPGSLWTAMAGDSLCLIAFSIIPPSVSERHVRIGYVLFLCLDEFRGMMGVRSHKTAGWRIQVPFAYTLELVEVFI